MKRKPIKKFVAGLAISSLLFGNLPISTVAASDLTGHWAEKYMTQLVNEHVLNGYEDGSLLPDKVISRAEFITMINKAFGYVEQGNTAFTDVKSTDWFSGEFQKAVKEGYLSGYEDGSVKPDNPITREEAATTIWRVSKLDKGSSNVLGRFKDAGSIQGYAKDAVASLVESEVINGYQDGTFGPANPITRGEAAAMLSKFASTIYSKADTTYTGEQGKTYGHVLVTQPGITLKDMTVEGNLYITPGVGEGNITLEGVTVKGKTYVAGGGANSLHLVNSKLGTMVTEKKNDKPVRVELQGNSSIEQAKLGSSTKLETTKLAAGAKGIQKVEVIKAIAKGIETTLSGNFPNVIVSADANVQLLSGSIENMETTGSFTITVKTASGASITKVKTAGSILINDKKVDAGKEAAVSGEGAVNVPNDASTAAPAGPAGGGSSSSGSSSTTRFAVEPKGFSSNVKASDTFSFTLYASNPVLPIDGGRVPSTISIHDGTANIDLSAAKMSVIDGTDAVTYAITGLPALDSSKSYTLYVNDPSVVVTARSFKPNSSANTDIKALTNGIHISSIDGAANSINMVPLYKVEHLLAEIGSTDSSMQTYAVVDSAGVPKALSSNIVEGDKLNVTAENGTVKAYALHISTLKANLAQYTVGQAQDIVLEYSINKANPNRQFLYGTLVFNLPDGITASPTDSFDLIGRGFVELNNDAIAAAKNYNQSGRSWLANVGNNADLRTKVEITNGGKTVTIKDTDFSNYNGVDLTLVLKNKTIPATGGMFTATFTGSGYPTTTATAAENYTETGTTKFNVSAAAADLVRKAEDVSYTTPTTAVLEAPSAKDGSLVYASVDKGLTWVNTGVTTSGHKATLTNLLPDTTYYFELMSAGTASNAVSYYTGQYDVTKFGAVADAVVTGQTVGQNVYGGTDNTAAINAAIVAASRNGGGTLYFKGNSSFGTGTLHLRSNVHLYLDENTQLVVLPNIDPAESSLNLPFINGQDDGHSYWQDALMWGIRVENIKILGKSAKIYGNMNLYTGTPTPAGTGTKSIALKLAKNIVIGGTDESHLLTIEQGGWFSILTTGCDDIRVQNIILPNSTSGRQRDTFNFMADNNATAYNVTTLKSSNDVAKLGSDFSLGFVRHVSNIRVEKIVAGDIAGGNVFQLGSETVGDMENIVATDLTLTTNANKTGAAIWVNDGSNIRNVTLSKLNLANTSGGIAFGVSPRYEGAVNGVAARLPNEIRRPGSISDVTVDGAVLSKNAGGDGGFPIVIQGFKRFAGSTTGGNVDFGSVGTITDGAVYPVKNITLKNVLLTASYNAAKFVPVLSDAFSVIAEAKNGGNYRTSTYANAKTFPAYGILMKYVDNVTVQDSKLTFDNTLKYDRYAIVIDNGTNVKLSNLDILMGGSTGGAVQVRGNSSYQFSGLQTRTFNKTYATQAPVAMATVTGSTYFDSSVQANLSQAQVYPLSLPSSVINAAALPSDGLDLSYTNTVLSVTGGQLTVAAGTQAQAVLSGIIALKPVKDVSVVNAAGTTVAATTGVTAGCKLKVTAPDGTITYVVLNVN
ncbi:S-layer homology domain-containing protein [Paenibacillus cremeus]|uniref:SLH domain-containing protein n=1 Tax=Paenibacillus cremeus TaxID=2163881 RepID=A0A559KGC8_9BACL|nr:S-layer homology domain-containing protein [Paenibacillus cremeus]TVY11181.1 hypothetical protein FPZ49_04935 [Paenibacillus cremeus]